jgi:sulfite reductase (NADPH) flavoprotein alpha-component
MTQPLSPPIMLLVPETAPFAPDQRAWLNGFFAGLVSLDGAGVTALTPEQNAAVLPQFPGGAGGSIGDDEGDAPWHDLTLPLAERMKLAEGHPMARRMMAAMAQQDCGQCGYNCRDYSAAIYERKEQRLNLCVPGGKETARMLKKLYEEFEASPPAAQPGVPATAETTPAIGSTAGTAAAATRPGHSRDNPVPAVFSARYLLNKPGSEKSTYHIEFDLSESGLDYVVGDAFGLFPANEPALVDAVLAAIEAPTDYLIGGRPLRDVLMHDISLSPAPDSLFEFISWLTGGDRRRKAIALAAGEDPDGDAETLDVLAALEKFAGPRPDPEALIESLEPLQPRLYSISSSPRVDPRRVSLTVDTVRYPVGPRVRLGAASTYLCERAQPGDKVRAYVQRAHAFGLPADSSVPIIMVGPGTGVAPFRAFLQERMATRAPGRNWLFFGHQHQACDFFYEDEFAGMKAAGVLNRLTLAWSRDGSEKIYVQSRMREEGAELWRWLDGGAHFYLCGDAKHMAKDVETALVDLVAEHGGRSKEDAAAYLVALKKTGRFQADVY